MPTDNLINERLGRIETKLEEHSRLLQEQKEKNDTLVEMKTLLAMQIEDSKKRDGQLEKFELTLLKVNDNLTNLNHNQQQMKTDMGEISTRVSDIERNQEEQKIDTSKFVKTALKELGKGIVTIIVAYLLYKWGISTFHG